jgi:hypothetical protein
MAPWAYGLTLGAAVLMLALGVGALVLIVSAYGSSSAALLLVSVLVSPGTRSARHPLVYGQLLLVSRRLKRRGTLTWFFSGRAPWR